MEALWEIHGDTRFAGLMRATEKYIVISAHCSTAGFDREEPMCPGASWQLKGNDTVIITTLAI